MMAINISVPGGFSPILYLVFLKQGDKTECGNYRGISLVSHVGKVTFKVASRAT